MSRGLLVRSLQIAAAATAALALVVAGWLAWHRPDHVAAWLALMPLCGP